MWKCENCFDKHKGKIFFYGKDSKDSKQDYYIARAEVEFKFLHTKQNIYLVEIYKYLV